MDLTQRKLNKSEWSSIEIPLPKQEIDILNLIIQGYYNINIRTNHNQSIINYLKIEYSEKMEDFIFSKFFKEPVELIEKNIIKINNKYIPIKLDINVKPNSSERIRMDKYYNDIGNKTTEIYEFILLENLNKLISGQTSLQHLNYFTIYKLIKNNISNLNRHIIKLVNDILKIFEENININTIIENGVECIEQNQNILKYEDLVLYEHQKEIFKVIRNSNPKLILYMAPTGTGKTLTPIALSEGKKIIFVCAARHVGLALARAAISVNKKVAFAFGCSSADDIRLHYFAAKEYSINKRTGGIKKVDNSVGDNVQLMICDIRSYLYAMYYMLAFFKAKDIILYWDEPTITLDYEEHEFHKTINKNWNENLIPNIVLSSATLPKLGEIPDVICFFKNKFDNTEIYNIVSYDCKKSIPLINKNGYVVLPHYLYDKYEEIINVARHCENYLTLLRYFDLREVINFIIYINKNKLCNERFLINNYFETLEDVNMKIIKLYYIKLLQNIHTDKWREIHEYFEKTRTAKILENNTIDAKGNKIRKIASIGPGINIKNSIENKLDGNKLKRQLSTIEPNSNKIALIGKTTTGTSGIYVTTKDSYTLTNGPTIFISNEIEKIAQFCIQQANIPVSMMDDIMRKIEHNNIIGNKIYELETQVDDIKEKQDKKIKNNIGEFHDGKTISGRKKSTKDNKKLNKEDFGEKSGSNELNKLTNDINNYRLLLKNVSLNELFVPNKKLHLEKWSEGLDSNNAFTSSIDDQTVIDIMSLKNIDNIWKVLLMMGIGIFINHENITYTEIMKKLADEQRLFLIIASSDYIYGTNYQFCHGYISKDLNLTQEKLIQALGRIGRTNIQQTYSIRFRDDSQILKLFTDNTDKPEVKNMNLLFGEMERHQTEENDICEIESDSE